MFGRYAYFSFEARQDSYVMKVYNNILLAAVTFLAQFFCVTPDANTYEPWH